VGASGARVVYVDGYVEHEDLKAAVEGRGYSVSCIEPG